MAPWAHARMAEHKTIVHTAGAPLARCVLSPFRYCYVLSCHRTHQIGLFERQKGPCFSRKRASADEQEGEVRIRSFKATDAAVELGTRPLVVRFQHGQVPCKFLGRSLCSLDLLVEVPVVHRGATWATGGLSGRILQPL